MTSFARSLACLLSPVSCLLLTVGCDKLAGLFPSTPKSTAAVTEPPAALMPSRPHVPQDQILAKVNDRVLGTRDLELSIQDLKATTEALGRPWTPLTPEQQRTLLDQLILVELQAQDGVARGLDRKTDVQSRFWLRYRNFFSQEWVSWQLDQLQQEITEAEVSQFYETNAMMFREPMKIRLRQLVVGLEDQAKGALVRIYEGMDFVTVAQQVSRLPEAAQGPMVEQQWVMRSAEKALFARDDPNVRALDPVLEQAAFAIDTPGSVSSYVKGADGNFHIFQLVERQEGRKKALTEVSDDIRNFLKLQKLADASQALQKRAKVETFAERLTTVEQP